MRASEIVMVGEVKELTSKKSGEVFNLVRIGWAGGGGEFFAEDGVLSLAKSLKPGELARAEFEFVPDRQNGKLFQARLVGLVRKGPG